MGLKFSCLKVPQVSRPQLTLAVPFTPKHTRNVTSLIANKFAIITYQLYPWLAYKGRLRKKPRRPSKTESNMSKNNEGGLPKTGWPFCNRCWLILLTPCIMWSYLVKSILLKSCSCDIKIHYSLVSAWQNGGPPISKNMM